MLNGRLISILFIVISLLLCGVSSSSTDPIIKYALTLLKPVIDDYFLEKDSILNQIQYEIPTINICLGTPRQCFSFSLSLNLVYLYVLGYRTESSVLQFFDKNKSETYKSYDRNFLLLHQFTNTASTYSNDILRGNEDLNSITPPSIINFFLIEEDHQGKDFKPSKIAGVIGLAKNTFQNNDDNDNNNNDSKSNFVFMTYLNYLFTNQHIKHNTMEFNYNDKTGGRLSFGDNFDDISFPYCSSKKSGHNRWICKFHKMKIGYSKFINKLLFIFDPSYPVIRGPYYVVSVLFKLILSISKQKCKLNKVKDIGVLTCNEDVNLNELSDFVLIYHDSELRIKMTNVFKLTEINGVRTQVCLIVGTDDDTEFILGLPAFNNNRLIFDQDNYKILFPSGTHLEEEDEFANLPTNKLIENSNYHLMIINIGIVIILILIAGIGILLFIYSVKL